MTNELEGVVELVQLNLLTVLVDRPVALTRAVTVGDWFLVTTADQRRENKRYIFT